MSFYDAFFTDKIDHTTKLNKILCIIEGKSEINFVKKIYDLTKEEIDIDFFINHKIKLSWGKDDIISYSTFQGGSLPSCLVPMPVIESLEKEDLDLYDAVIIMFDKDKDQDNYVENYSKHFVQDYENFFLLSSPCFEHTSFYLCEADNTFLYISNNYQIIDDSLCNWYKKNYSKIPKNRRFKYCQSLKNMIKTIKLEDLEQCNNTTIKDFFSFLEKNFT